MYVDIGDLKVAYDIKGQGYPLVMLHGGGSNSSHFEDIVPELARSFQVHTMDLRGFGKTVRPAEPKLSHELWLSDLGAFLDHFGLKKVALAGWSLGARISLNFTIAHPERVSQLVMIGGSSPLMPQTDRSGFNERLKLIDSGLPQAEIVARTFDFTKRAFSPWSLEHNPHAVERLHKEHLSNDPVSYAEMVRANMVQPQASAEQVGSIACPTLLVVGESDGRCPVELSESLNKAIPDSFLKIIPNCGHFYGYEQPEATARAISTFLSAFVH